MEFTRYASNGKANAGLGLGISGTALGVLNSLGNCGNGILGGLFGGNHCNSGGTDALAAAALISNANGGCWNRGGECSENQFITRYELNQQKEIIALEAKVAEKDTQIALRDANTYSDQKSIELYRYIDGKLIEIERTLSNQAVRNQATQDSINLVQERLDCSNRELNEKICQERNCRKCADNTIVNYVNQTFYPKQVADVTVGTTNTPQSTYNPLPVNNCGCCCGNN